MIDIIPDHKNPGKPKIRVGFYDDKGRSEFTADVTPDMKVCSLEVFGPVVGVAAYDDLD